MAVAFVPPAGMITRMTRRANDLDRVNALRTQHGLKLVTKSQWMWSQACGGMFVALGCVANVHVPVTAPVPVEGVLKVPDGLPDALAAPAALAELTALLGYPVTCAVPRACRAAPPGQLRVLCDVNSNVTPGLGPAVVTCTFQDAQLSISAATVGASSF